MYKNISLASHELLCDKTFLNDHLKLCYLWYDEILVDNFIFKYENVINELNLDEKDISNVTDIILPLEKRVSKYLIEEYKHYIVTTKYYPRWERNEKYYNTYRKPKNSDEYAHNAIINSLKRKYGMDYDDFEHFEGKAMFTIGSIKLWNMINNEIPIVLQSNEYERIAIKSKLLFDKKYEKDEKAPFRLFEMYIPSLENVPWAKIVEMKNNSNFFALQKK